jgi:DNA-binding IclR family transcriptional regulator
VPDRYELTEDQLRVLDGLAASDSTSRSELIDRSGVAERAVRSALDRVREHGLADYTGEKRGARWRLVGIARRAYGLPPIVER